MECHNKRLEGNTPNITCVSVPVVRFFIHFQHFSNSRYICHECVLILQVKYKTVKKLFQFHNLKKKKKLHEILDQVSGREQKDNPEVEPSVCGDS